jgi:F-type H+-transporting ATPase subunit epsilon
MASFPFELVSPEQLLISEPADQVIVPGLEGEFTVLAGHAPLVSTMRPGIVTVDAGGTTQRLFVRGGLAEVTPDRGLTILADLALPIAELDAARFASEIAIATEEVARARDDESRRRAQERLDHMRELEATLGRTPAAAH